MEKEKEDVLSNLFWFVIVLVGLFFTCEQFPTEAVQGRQDYCWLMVSEVSIYSKLALPVSAQQQDRDIMV